MAIQKMPVEVLFGQGIDTKTSGVHVQTNKLLQLSNAIFDNQGQLSKRNGFGTLTQLPDTTSTTLSTLNGSLVATGAGLKVYSPETNQWLSQGSVQPVQLSAASLVRTSASQTAVDAAVSDSGLVCLTYLEGGVPTYLVSDAASGQQVVKATTLPTGATDPRVFILGSYFIVTYKILVTGNTHLVGLPLPMVKPNAPTAPVTMAVSLSGINAAYDCAVQNGSLYYAWNAGDVGGAVRVAFLTSALVVSATKVIAGAVATLMSVAVQAGTVAVTYHNSGTSNGYVTTFTPILLPVLSNVQVISSQAIVGLTSAYAGTMLEVYYQISNVYSGTSVRSDYVMKALLPASGTAVAGVVFLRSVGLASKAFTNVDGTVHVALAYGGAFQPTYLLVDDKARIIAKWAYSNGGGYITGQVLPSVSVLDNDVYLPYLYKDLLVSVNKSQGLANPGGLYTQTGVNLLTLNINQPVQYSAEIAGTLNLTGGIVWQFDGVSAVEQGFNVWPEDVTGTTATTGGALTAQQYYYQFTYEWTDSQGNLHRSAPSLPVGVLTTGSTSANTLQVPTLRLTYKASVRIVGYRWSAGQQEYYQFTTVAAPVLNDPTTDTVSIVDTAADSAILGNTLLYTTGGVLENIAPPAAAAVTLFQGRAWLVDSEDRNLLRFSKQVIEAVPLEFSDLLSVYVAPTTGAQGSTGDVTALASMDDKLIIFKKDAIYYLNGLGPDNTGASNGYSDPTFITAAVGCANPSSIVLTPTGLMFQSDKGIWLLNRALATEYVGADVEGFNSSTVNSALTIPGTNQVRFGLSTGQTLVYDYYYRQWGTFTGAPSLSATLYKGAHTLLDSRGTVYSETPAKYLDGARPVLVSFTTSWIKLAGLQGYQRAYFIYLLSNYMTPHKLAVSISYDYSPSATQVALIVPTNFSPAYGADSLYGAGSPYGGQSSVEQWRIFLNQQKCESIQISVVESYDPSKGAAAGAGLVFQGLSFIVGAKKAYDTLTNKQSVS